jgi:hypothetical protein
MPFSEWFAQLRACCDKLAAVLSVLLLLFKLFKYVRTGSGEKKLNAKMPSSWSPRNTRPTSTRWSTPDRTRFSKKWSVNDLPRPQRG